MTSFEFQGAATSSDAAAAALEAEVHSPVFAAVRYDLDRAEELDRTEGDSTPVHSSMPLAAPWVSLRILTFDKPATELVEADIFLLTPERPTLLPGHGSTSPSPSRHPGRSSPISATTRPPSGCPTRPGSPTSTSRPPPASSTSTSPRHRRDAAPTAQQKGRPAGTAAAQ